VTTHIAVRIFYIRIVLVSVGLPPYIQQYAAWLKFLNLIILYREEIGWLYSSVSQLSLALNFAARIFSMCTASI
jgi:hypothetical protein